MSRKLGLWQKSVFLITKKQTKKRVDIINEYFGMVSTNNI